MASEGGTPPFSNDDPPFAASLVRTEGVYLSTHGSETGMHSRVNFQTWKAPRTGEMTRQVRVSTDEADV